jgi:cytochrome c-type biogenesis protein CcmH/NrfG
MTLWLVVALMTAATVFAVLWPLARRSLACDFDKLRCIEGTIKSLGFES